MYLSLGDLPVNFPVSTMGAPVELITPSLFFKISSIKLSTFRFLCILDTLFRPI